MNAPAVDRRGFLAGASAVAVAAVLPRAATVCVNPLSTYVDPDISRVIFGSPPCRGFSLPILEVLPLSGRLFAAGDVVHLPGPGLLNEPVALSRVVPGTERDNA